MSKKTYYEKLKDPRWQKKRLEAMERNQFCCEVCGDDSEPLHVHHKEYFKDHDPWDYELIQLAVLCESCHGDYHDSFDILKWVCSLARIDGPEDRVEIAFIIAGYLGISYDNVLSISSIEDSKYYKLAHECGEMASLSFKSGLYELSNNAKSAIGNQNKFIPDL